MATDVEIERALATVSATVNDQRLEQFDRERFQELLDEALGSEHRLTCDDGGGLHDESGARVGAVRMTDTGKWHVERQNPEASRSHVAIPTVGPQSKLRRLMTKLKMRTS
jgi:hypothetical protein